MNAKLSDASRAQIRADLTTALDASRIGVSPANPSSGDAENFMSTEKVKIDEATTTNVEALPC